MDAERQKTVQKKVEASGIGIFSGEKVSLTILPAPENTGILFQRVDLPNKPKIPAHLNFVKEAPRCTRLAGQEASIYMVEHLLAAFAGMGIDNAMVEVEGPEILAADGSAKFFIDLLEQAGIEVQGAPQKILRIQAPIFWSKDEVHLIALPSDTFRVSYTLHYPQSPLIGSQFYTFQWTPEAFKREIAPCRTFSLYEEVVPLLEKGVIKGGGLGNGVIIKGDHILNPEGVRFTDEMVRHKVLDLIGDLSLLDRRIAGHIISVRSGHASNIEFANKIAKSMGF